ncbi:hypothetical protein K4F52_009210 [Lecanicillium sp. MT-2017a]|nr:hypothetical protein K4F52_009210 [Lecanicillium sp. MT-2017a]
MWYKRQEQPLRQAGWYLGNTFAGIFGGIIAYGIGHIESIAPWKTVFLIFGAVTVTWSIGVFFLLPDEPKTAWFLSKEDRVKAIKRVASNMTGVKTNKIQWYQCREAFLDINVWLLVIIQISGQIANGGVQGFGSIAIQGFGFSIFKTLKIQMVSFVFQLIFVIIATTGSTFLRNTRTLWMVFGMGFSIAGAAMVQKISTDNIWGRFFGYCLTMGYTPKCQLFCQ